MTSIPSFAQRAAAGLQGKRVFIRSDLNVPLDSEGRVADDTRITASLEAIRLALKAGAAVMVTSHLGRPREGALTAADSLAPVVEVLAQHLGQGVRLVKDWLTTPFVVGSGEVVVLENCRGNLGEKANSEELSRAMSRLADVYVNDAFATAHRAEATTVGMAAFVAEAYAGPLLLAEVEALSQALDKPRKPLVAIVGGSKVSTKLTVLANLAAKVDVLILGGGIANTFLLAAGHPIGKSLAERDLVEEAKRVTAAMTARGGQVLLPVDVVVAKAVAADAQAVEKKLDQVAADDLILDVGKTAREEVVKALKGAGTIVWNGPLGVFEMAPFAAGTRALAEAVAASPAFSLAGGGDTVLAVHQFGVTEGIDYISTAGGAFLEFLEGKTLPALAALSAAASRQKKA